MNQKIVIIGIILVILMFALVIKSNIEMFDPVPMSSSFYRAKYNYLDANNFPPECANTIFLTKNYNNNNDIIQILQDGTFFEDSQKCYQAVAKKMNLPPDQFYNKCVTGQLGLPGAVELCNTASFNQNCGY